MALKLLPPFPNFPPNFLPPSLLHHRHGSSSTELRFSRWHNANAEPFERRRRQQQEIETDIRLHRRYDSISTILSSSDDPSSADQQISAVDFKSNGSPSLPSPPSIPGRRSKYSKPPNPNNPNSHPAFRKPRPKITLLPPAESSVVLGEKGLAYKIEGAPFEFQYSYTETPKVKPVALREVPFLPFGPATMPRPWTGRAPLPGSKKKLPEFDSFVPPPAGKKGVKPVQAPGPFISGSGPKYAARTREEVIGDPLTEEEVKDLIKGCVKSTRQLNMGRDGLTHNMLDNIHAHWKRRRVCKIKCKGVCTVDMDNVHEQLEEKTGGKVIYRRGGLIYLFRGRHYNYRTRPRYPLMLWKPVTPVYPRLVQRAPEGLTLEEATEMRKRGRQLPPICKLGKNGVYHNLVNYVKEAFEACELVRIDCTGLERSDCRKIGGKLKDLVPCVLMSFEFEHILLWRGHDWKSSLVPQEDIHNKPVELVADSSSSTTTSTELAPVAKLNTEAVDMEEDTETVSKNSVLIQEEESFPDSINCSSEDLHTISQYDASSLEITDTTDTGDTGFQKACLDGIMQLLQQAVDSGSALLLDDDTLDANIVYEKSISLAKSSQPGPVFQHRRKKVAVEKSEKEGSECDKEQDVESEAIIIEEKKIDKMYRSLKREELKEVISEIVPRGSLRVDELAKLLA